MTRAPRNNPPGFEGFAEIGKKFGQFTRPTESARGSAEALPGAAIGPDGAVKRRIAAAAGHSVRFGGIATPYHTSATPGATWPRRSTLEPEVVAGKFLGDE